MPQEPTAPAWFRGRWPCRSPTSASRWRARGPLPGLGRAAAGAGLVFVHGGGAHAHWWTHVAATFADEFRVLAIDLSRPRRQRPPRRVRARAVDRRGHGGGRATAASPAARWSSATAWAGSSPSPPRPCHADRRRRRHHLRLAGHRARPRDRRRSSSSEAFGAPRTYATVDEALRPVPHRARRRTTTSTTSSTTWPGARCKAVDGGWQWKFDRRIFEQFAGGHARRRAPLPRRR